jgi:hypothetical protein
MVAILLIVILRQALPTNMFWLILLVILAPIAGYLISYRMTTRMESRPASVSIKGNILFNDGSPVNGATVFVEGVDRKKFSDETGWFEIKVDEQASWTVRALWKGQVDERSVSKEDASKPVRLTIDNGKQHVYSEEERAAVGRIEDSLSALHKLDNVIRTTLGEVMRFDHNMTAEKRGELAEGLGELADSEEILSSVRQNMSGLEASAAKLGAGGILKDAADAVLSCGRATLKSFGRSKATPWDGHADLLALIDSVRAADSPELANGIRAAAEEVYEAVDRDCLREADELLGHLEATIRK